MFVIAREPSTIRAIQEAGQEIPALVIGGTVTPAEGVEAMQVGRKAYVTPAEAADLLAIAVAGVPITAQYVPADKPEPLSKYISF